MPLRKSPRPTPALVAANHTNALKSTGPRSEEGKQRVSLNLRPAPARLLGLAEARNFIQDAGAAEKLYRDLLAPFEPAPALLAMHFQDLARLQLEL
ncbi:MAG TPA: hypothetical protein VL523_01450, partial [Terriglobia bacterium]|nr:hypothetical protein [Terriglobia bacterium]